MKTLIIATMIAVLPLTAIAQTTIDVDMSDVVMVNKDKDLVFQVIIKFTNSANHKALKKVPEFEKESYTPENKRERLVFEGYQRNRVLSERLNNNTFETIEQDLGVEIRHVRSLSLGNDLIEITTKKPVSEVMDALKNHDEISKAALNRTATVKTSMSTSVATGETWDGTYYNDPMYQNQTYFGGLNQNKANGNFEAFKQNLENNLGRKLRIGVIDTGSANHEDLVVDGGYSFVSSVMFDGTLYDVDRKPDPIDLSINPDTGDTYVQGHGTAVASVITAITDNGLGMTGALDGEDVELLQVRGCSVSGCSITDTADAIVWLAGGEVAGVPNIETPVDIINLSLGGYNPLGCGVFYQEAVDFALSQGVVITTAAGNENIDASGTAPAGCKGAITVASVDPSREDKSTFSNYGNAVDIAVPGSNIITARSNMTDPTILSSDYASSSGTSFASPLAAAIVGGLIMKYPDLTAIQIERILEANAYEIEFDKNGNISDCVEFGCGAGVVEAFEALTSIENLFTMNKSKVNHVYEDNNDTRYLEEMNNIVPVCELYKSQFGSIGAAIDGIEYNLYTYTGEGEINENNATLVDTVKDPIVVMNSADRIAYQACQNGSCGDIFEMSKAGTSKPEYCN